MKLSFGLKAKRPKFATQFDDEDDEDEAEAKRKRAERASSEPRVYTRGPPPIVHNVSPQEMKKRTPVRCRASGPRPPQQR
jgi:hypothetical protein